MTKVSDAGQSTDGKSTVAVAAVTAAKLAEPQIHPEADRIMKAMCAKLKQAQRFSYKAEIWEDQIVGAGHKLSTSKTVVTQVRRPDGVHTESHSPKRTRGFWYDGKTVTMLDRVKNLYGVVNAPETIDKMLDAASDQYGITIPLDDLLLSDPGAGAKASVQAAAYFGKTTILGVPCEHLAFATPAVDWQLWVEDGGTGMPRKLLITYKLEDTAPQFTAIFSDWALDASIPDSAFTFTPPEGSAKIDMLPAKPVAN